MISALRTALLANLELPCAPLWVWLAFGEVPAPLTFVGGGIVCLAILLELTPRSAEARLGSSGLVARMRAALVARMRAALVAGMRAALVAGMRAARDDR